ncbi:hypothetical protein F5146DRAFT_199179 [Armillaria mellea]|nr:hypothetical protein F5146DRAFT_199179 [Armillaria mellea]
MYLTLEGRDISLFMTPIVTQIRKTSFKLAKAKAEDTAENERLREEEQHRQEETRVYREEQPQIDETQLIEDTHWAWTRQYIVFGAFDSIQGSEAGPSRQPQEEDVAEAKAKQVREENERLYQEEIRRRRDERHRQEEIRIRQEEQQRRVDEERFTANAHWLQTPIVFGTFNWGSLEAGPSQATSRRGCG